METDEPPPPPSPPPKIIIKQLKRYPKLEENGKIPTNEFLEASRDVVSCIEKFGKMFSPVVSDMNGNIEKLHKCYVEKKDEYYYLEDMIGIDIKRSESTSKESLLWLNRALELIERFFTNILNDPKIEENLKVHLKDAYDLTLKQHHGWLIQETFKIIYRWIPLRSQLIGVNQHHDENINELKLYIPLMKVHLNQINHFYTNLK